METNDVLFALQRKVLEKEMIGKCLGTDHLAVKSVEFIKHVTYVK